MRNGRIKKLFWNLFTSGTFDRYRDDVDVYLRFLMVNAIGIVAGACLLAYGILDTIRGIQPLGGLIIAAGVLVVFNLVFLRLTENHIAAAWVAAIILTAGFMFLLSTGGGGNTGPLWLYTLPGAAMILLGVRAGSWLYFGFLLYTAAVLFIPGNPLLRTRYSPDFVIRFIPTMLTVLVMVYIFEAMRQLSQKSILGKNLELEASLELVKVAEEKARRSEQRFRDLADLLPQTVFELDLEGRVTYSNRIGLELFGYVPSELEAGLNVYNLFPPDEREKAGENIARVLRGEASREHEYRARKKNGVLFPVLVYTSPIVREGRAVGLRGILLDLSERKKIEEDLLKARKLKSVGILAGGIAHDFNNLLTAILGNISLARVETAAGGREDECLQEAEEACFRAKQLTRRLLTFSEGGHPIPRMMKIGEVVRAAVDSALEQLPAAGSVEIEDDPGELEVDPDQLAEAVGNLVKNAAEAMGGGGRVEVRLGKTRPVGRARLSLPEGEYARISIRDQGPGIPEEMLERIFDPYFTTREMGRGLGLTVAYSIIKNHRGLLTVEAGSGPGAEFHIYLPLPDGGAGREKPAPGKENSSGRRILFMDDQENVRKVAVKMLEEFGYEAVPVADGREAIESYREAAESGRPFAAVVLDLTVPGGMGGVMAAARIRGIDPRARLIVSSGYSDDPVLADYRRHGFSGKIDKPYQIANMREVLAEVLGSPPSA